MATALITGASSGLGYEFSKLFAADGYDLVLVARSKGKLEELAAELSAQHKIKARVLAKDLSQSREVEETFQELQGQSVAVDVLVNNAGYGDYGAFAELETKRQLGMIELNIAALTQLTKLFLPAMIQRKGGRILNVASTAAFQPGPFMAVYYASKAYVLSFSEALAEELRGSGVTVTTLCPGPTLTGFVKGARMEQSKLFDLGAMDAPTVARIGYKGLMSGKTLVIPGLRNRIMAESVRLAPRKLLTRVVRKMQERRT